MPKETEAGPLFGDDEDAEFYRWYGRWQPLDPAGTARLLDGAGVRWWIVGGWAVDAFIRQSREHEDIDISFFKADLPAVVDHLAPDYCIWSNASGTLRPLRKATDLLPDCRQLWLRRDGDSPWLADFALNPQDGQTWISARWEGVRLPIDEALFTGDDGLSYLRPEIVIWMKAHRTSAKDERDLALMLPMLETHRRAWLRRTLKTTHPGHKWLRRLT